MLLWAGVIGNDRLKPSPILGAEFDHDAAAVMPLRSADYRALPQRGESPSAFPISVNQLESWPAVLRNCHFSADNAHDLTQYHFSGEDTPSLILNAA